MPAEADRSLAVRDRQVSTLAKEIMRGIDLIYLDVEFITGFYEESRDLKVPISVTKASNYSGGGGIAGFVSVGASKSEQKEYKLDVRAMLHEIESELHEYPNIDLYETADSDLPEVFWLEGVFGLVGSSLQRGNEVIGRSCHYQFVPKIKDNERAINLITNDVYFSSGYDQIAKHHNGASHDFAIKAKILVRTLFVDKYNAIATPIIIRKISNLLEHE